MAYGFAIGACERFLLLKHSTSVINALQDVVRVYGFRGSGSGPSNPQSPEAVKTLMETSTFAILSKGPLVELLWSFPLELSS